MLWRCFANNRPIRLHLGITHIRPIWRPNFLFDSADAVVHFSWSYRDQSKPKLRSRELLQNPTV